MNKKTAGMGRFFVTIRPMREILEKHIQDSLFNLGLSVGEVHLEHPADLTHGDYSTNVAMTLAKKEGKNPKDLAEEILGHLVVNKPKEIEKIEIAGPGFINFHLSRDFYAQSIEDILKAGDDWGKNDDLEGEKIGLEYYQPNFFKALHIGHLVNIIVGESLARLFAFSGADVHRIAYYSDIGPHIAMAVWGLKDLEIDPKTPEDLSKAYEHGRKEYENNKEEIDNINVALYEKGTDEVHELFERGTQVSREQVEEMRERIGVTFDVTFHESEAGDVGKDLVLKNVPSVFQESDGAIIFKGEDHGLHTRVFLNNRGLPVYETKDLGLVELKLKEWDADHLVYVTDVEQSEYFKVLIKAAEMVHAKSDVRFSHVAHGRLSLSSGRMSSREGNVLMADDVLNEARDEVQERIDDKTIAEQIAQAAFKYVVLKQSVGRNIVYNKEQSLSFEGDSGPYLQYAHTRAQSVIKKSDKKPDTSKPGDATVFEKLLYRFPEVVKRAATEREPHHVTHYLTELAGAFNSWYENEKIIGSNDEEYKLALVSVFAITMKNGLWVLGIEVPEKM